MEVVLNPTGTLRYQQVRGEAFRLASEDAYRKTVSPCLEVPAWQETALDQ